MRPKVPRCVCGHDVSDSPLAAACLSLVGCDTTSPDEPEPRPDEQPADDPADEQPTDDERPPDDEPDHEPSEDDPPEDDPAVDIDPSPDPSTGHAVELTSWVDEAPANLKHRIEGTVTDDSCGGEFGDPVRFEVHRDDTLLLAVERQTEADGEVLFSYNAGARPGDTDVVVACALDQRTADPGDGEAGTAETNASDDAAEQRVTISLTPPEVMRYLLTSSTDVDGCL